MAPRSPRPLPGTRFVEFDSHQCQACWSCIDACPKQVIGKVSVLWHKHAALRRAKTASGVSSALRSAEGARRWTSCSLREPSRSPPTASGSMSSMPATTGFNSGLRPRAEQLSRHLAESKRQLILWRFPGRALRQGATAEGPRWGGPDEPSGTPIEAQAGR